jgi:hypothetical protein
MLEAKSPLLARGLLAASGNHDSHPLDREFLLTETALTLLTASNKPTINNLQEGPKPYYDSIHHLMAYRELLGLYSKRAALLFPQSIWADQEEIENETSESLTHSISAARLQIREREQASDHLALIRLRHEYGLREEEELVVLALLFQELYASTPDLEGAELIRLASASPTDAIRYRHMVAPDSHLLECCLIMAQREEEGKPNLCLCRLPDWVVNQLVAIPAEPGIPSNERQRFHHYLENLNNSEDFFRRL